MRVKEAKGSQCQDCISVEVDDGLGERDRLRIIAHALATRDLGNLYPRRREQM